METILVTGASGYIGRNLIPVLKNNFHVKCLVRANSKIDKIKDSKLIYGDLKDKSSLTKALKEVRIVIHLAAITDVLNKTIEEVNVLGTKNLIETCEKNNIKRFIFISSTAAYHANDVYGKSKKQAEEIISKSRLKYTILRPSFIYSKDSQNLLSIIKINKKIPFFTPIISNGKYKINPVSINDVISAILAVIDNKQTINKTYNILGPEYIEFNEFIDIINKNFGLKRKKLHIPIPICLIIAKILEKLINKPILTISTINAIKNTSNYDIIGAKKDFNYNPIDFKNGMLKIWNTGQY